MLHKTKGNTLNYYQKQIEVYGQNYIYAMRILAEKSLDYCTTLEKIKNIHEQYLYWFTNKTEI